jgi:ribonuclease BN (tRNA processing enzyme)
VLHDAALRLADRVDVLIHGAMYTREELPARIAFGHAAADYAVELGERCRVGRVVLFHHEPWRDDEAVVAVRDAVAATTSLRVEHAVEGRILVL